MKDRLILETQKNGDVKTKIILSCGRYYEFIFKSKKEK